LRSLAFLGLHAAVAGPYAMGLLRGNRTPAKTLPSAGVELVGRPSALGWARRDGEAEPLADLTGQGMAQAAQSS